MTLNICNKESNRYVVRTNNIVVEDTIVPDTRFEFTNEQWETALLLIRCYPHENKVPGIKFLRDFFKLSLSTAKVLYEAALEQS